MNDNDLRWRVEEAVRRANPETDAELADVAIAAVREYDAANPMHVVETLPLHKSRSDGERRRNRHEQYPPRHVSD